MNFEYVTDLVLTLREKSLKICWRKKYSGGCWLLERPLVVFYSKFWLIPATGQASLRGVLPLPEILVRFRGRPDAKEKSPEILADGQVEAFDHDPVQPTETCQIPIETTHYLPHFF